MKYLRGFLMAWGNFSALPCPYHKWHEESRKAMLAMLPMVGAVLGVVVTAVWCVLEWIGVPSVLIGAFVTAVYFCCTGFIHLDGFMDCSDAILSRRPELEQRQRILKDSNVGAFAVVSVALMLLVFAASLIALADLMTGWIGLVFAGAAITSRAVAADAVLGKSPMGTSQYADLEGAGSGKQVRAVDWFRHMTALWIAALVPLILIFAVLFVPGVLHGGEMAEAVFLYLGASIAAAVAAHIAGHYGRKQLGGMSGDIAGYMIVWSELAAVIAAALMAAMMGS